MVALLVAAAKAQRDFRHKQSSPARIDVLMPPIGQSAISYNQYELWTNNRFSSTILFTYTGTCL